MYYAHESSFVDQPCRIGEGSQVWHFCHIMSTADIGKNCILGQNVFVGPGVVLGNNVKVQNNVSIYSAVTCEDDVFLGPSMVFTNVSNPRSFINRKQDFRPTLIKKGASIGANATIVCGNTIGQYAIIGAGSVVTKDVADYALVYGVPARQMGWVCRCGEKLEFDGAQAQCPACSASFVLLADTVKALDKA